jgi:hypothetical protein
MYTYIYIYIDNIPDDRYNCSSVGFIDKLASKRYWKALWPYKITSWIVIIGTEEDIKTSDIPYAKTAYAYIIELVTERFINN